MNTKKYLLVAVLMMALVALIGLGVDAAEAKGGGKTAPTHAPVCTKLYTNEYYELQCTDSGNDIIVATVKTDAKYTLDWDMKGVTLRVYVDPARDDVRAFWHVQDSAGTLVSGTLP